MGGKLLKCIDQHSMYIFENSIGWHLVYEVDAYCLINTVYT